MRHFSSLKTLFLCFIEEFLFFLGSHLGSYTSDMGYEFLWIHLLWWVGGVRRGRGCRSSICGGGCPLFVWAKSADVPWFIAIETQPLLHPFSLFFGGYCVDIHCVWISTLDVPSSFRLFSHFLWSFSWRSSQDTLHSLEIVV